MKQPSYSAINARREQMKRNAEAARTSEVAHAATQIQQQTGCTRSEALRVAEKNTPHRA